MSPFLIIFLLSFLLISWAGSRLVTTLTSLAKIFGLSEYLIAFVLMSFATSIPELMIGLSSTFQDVVSISIGDILGANLINLTLVIGALSIATGGIRVESKISRRNFLLISLLAFAPILLATDGLISRGDGLFLIAMFTFYLFRIFHEREYFSKQIADTAFITKNVLSSITMFFVGIGVLMGSAFLLIWSAKNIIVSLDISLVLFGIVFVALGTTLPEIAFGIKAVTMKHPSMVLGNSLGSIAFNAAGIVGIIALIKPITLSFDGSILIATGFLFIALVLFNLLAYSRGALSRKEGIVLVLVYLGFLAFEFVAYYTDIIPL